MCLCVYCSYMHVCVCVVCVVFVCLCMAVFICVCVCETGGEQGLFAFLGLGVGNLKLFGVLGID